MMFITLLSASSDLLRIVLERTVIFCCDGDLTKRITPQHCGVILFPWVSVLHWMAGCTPGGMSGVPQVLKVGQFVSSAMLRMAASGPVYTPVDSSL